MPPSSALASILDELSSQLDRDTVIELVGVYAENSETQVKSIEKAAANGDSKEINAQAHSLKSSSANMGAIELSEICQKIEKASSVDENVRQWVRDARRLRDEAIKQMKSWASASN